MTPDSNVPALKFERTFRATPEKLWSYWTDPKKYARWLNPSPADLVVHEWDARPGGRVRFDMPQPDGNKHPQEGVFHELEPYTRLVTGSPDRSFLITVRFAPASANETRMTVEVVGVPPDWHAAATEGWGRGLEKLRADLEAPEGGFGIVREFAAPPEKVWALWTTKEGIERWWAPSMRDMGFEMKVLRMDVRVGGGFAFSMAGHGHDLVNAGTYTTVDARRKLAWTWHFDIFLAPDEKPYDVPIVVELERTPSGGTRMRFTQGALASAGHTEGSREGVMKNLDRMAKALEA